MQGCRGRGAELLQESTVSVARRLSDVDSIDAITGYGTDAIGLCIEKRESYCCFNSPLSRMIQEQVRPQLGLPFGDAELGEIVRQRRGGKTIKISLDEL